MIKRIVLLNTYLYSIYKEMSILTQTAMYNVTGDTGVKLDSNPNLTPICV